MTTKHPLVLAATLAGLAFLAGCASEPGAQAPQDSTKYTLESTENFELLGTATANSIACTGLQPRVLPDGRLEVVVNVKNRLPQGLKVQLNCVFKDEQGFTTGDETPLETVQLAGHATEAVTFTARDVKAKKFTVRARTLN